MVITNVNCFDQYEQPPWLAHNGTNERIIPC